MPSRRRLLGAALGACAGTILPRSARGGAPAPLRPHYIVHIILTGGTDSVLSVDPKDSKQSGLDIDAGYRADQMVRGEKRFYGPLIGALLRHESELSLVHGVRIDTVSHEDALVSLSRGKASNGPSTAAIGDVLGSCLRGDAPIEFLSLQDRWSFMRRTDPRGYLPRGVSIAPEVSRDLLDPDGFRVVHRPWFLRSRHDRDAELRSIFSPDEAAVWVERDRQADAVNTMLRTADHTTRFVDKQLGHKLQLALHAIHYNHARYITVASEYARFDSHTDNLRLQEQRVGTAYADIATFIDVLKTERNAFGPLYDQVTIAIGTELGRYPKINATRGKDHWPENSWILLGKGLRKEPGGVTLGATDLRYRGMPVDYQTGSASSGNRRPIFIDSVFATLIAIAGGDPAKHGYSRDDVLTYLLAGAKASSG